MPASRTFFHLDGAGLLLLLALPALLALGSWQLQRADEKRSLQETLRARAAAPPVDIRRLDAAAGAAADWHGLRVVLRGRYDNERVWYLDNRMYRRRVGFEAITPFRLAGGMNVLVNRGWRAGDPARRRLPGLGEAPAELLQLQGSIHQPRKKMLLLAPEPQTRAWPRLIQRVDMERMRTEAGGEVFPYLVRLDPDQPGVRPADWKMVRIDDRRHRGYALTWFSLATLLLLLQGLRMYKRA